MTVSIYQIQYSDLVVGGFDPDFITHDCRENPENEKRESAHMQRFFNEGLWKKNNSQYFGLVSPKFNDKCQLRGSDFIDWINKNPGYDVYFVNPFPQLQYFHYNIWEQAEYYHPGLLEIADFLFESADLDIQTKRLPRNSSDTLLYCNYWVANEAFWQKFMEFVNKLTAAIDNMTVEKRNIFFAPSPDYASATNYPFIFERMFSTFLNLDKSFRCLSYPYQKDEVVNLCTNDFERLIITDWAELIDGWDAQNRDDPETREMFSNLENMQRMFSSYDGKVMLSEVNNQGLWNKFYLKLRKYFL